ncbi:MAG: hypothetical protein ACMUIE_01480 [Thermoplasmatota archaeon]
MAGSAISEMIFFIAAIVVSSAVAVTLIGVVENYSDEISEEAALLRGEMSSKIRIINDPLYVNYETSSGNLTFYLKNTGSGDLSKDDIVVSANGTARSGSQIRTLLLNGGAVWKPGSVVEVEFNSPGLVDGVDYQGWAATSGITSSGRLGGNAQDTIVFRIKEV